MGSPSSSGSLVAILPCNDLDRSERFYNRLRFVRRDEAVHADYRILSNGAEICLILNSSVNAYRRLDPHFEAPNQIKASTIDRGSMIRIPLGNERSKRVEVRSIAPDANPYLALYSVFRTGLEGPLAPDAGAQSKYLSDNIYDAIRLYQGSAFYKQMLGAEVHGKFADLKLAQADRCPRALGSVVKAAEIQFHHEVTNQHLWSQF